MANKYPSRLVTCRYCKKQDIDRNKQIEGVDWISPSNRHYYHCNCYTLKLEEDNLKAAKILTDEMAAEDWNESAYYYLKNEIKIVIDYQRLDREWERLVKKGRTPKGIYFITCACSNLLSPHCISSNNHSSKQCLCPFQNSVSLLRDHPPKIHCKGFHGHALYQCFLD